MNFEMIDELPLVSVQIEFNGLKKTFNSILVDTGCASTILDTDLCEEIGLLLDLENAITRKMYGIGGFEICIEQMVNQVRIDEFCLKDFPIQLGDIRELHGFDGILGSDFFLYNKLIIDYETMEIRKKL